MKNFELSKELPKLETVKNFKEKALEERLKIMENRLNCRHIDFEKFKNLEIKYCESELQLQELKELNNEMQNKVMKYKAEIMELGNMKIKGIEQNYEMRIQNLEEESGNKDEKIKILKEYLLACGYDYDNDKDESGISD